MTRQVTLALVAAVAGLTAGCGEQETGGGQPKPSRDTALVDTSKPAPYVNDLDIDPSDGAFLLTTNKGFYRVKDGKVSNVKSSITIGGRTASMGTFVDLSVTGPGTYLGSGHPDPGGPPGIPEFLGVLRSEDAGATWNVVSRLGDADVHKFVVLHDRIYGWDAVLSAMIISSDGGRTFEEHFTPRGLILDFEVDPEDPQRIVASNEQQLFSTTDSGERWRALLSLPGIRLAWPAADRLYRAGADGIVWTSPDGGKGWVEVGKVDGVPADFEAVSKDELYLALTDGSITHTTDGGRTWAFVFRP